MGIFDSLFKKKIQHLIQENGNCEIYSKDGSISKKFNLYNGLLDGKYECYTIHGEVWLTLNFKKGKLHGECLSYSSARNCIEFLEKFIDGVLIFSQRCKKVDGNDSNTLLGNRYELDSPITDELILKEQGSFIKNISLVGEYSEISNLRSVGVKFKLLTD